MYARSHAHATITVSPQSQVKLTCQVPVDGEHKSVSFLMDFLQDSPRSVAKEMIDELMLDGSAECA